MELQQVIYNVLKMQIQFGAYRYEERLPTIEDATRLFQASIKTIRSVYQQLAHDGFITISKRIGVKVSVRYNEQDTKEHIQKFFAEREAALLDLSRSSRLLFSNAQWLGFQNTTPEQLDEMQRLASPKESLSPYIMTQQLHIIYGALRNPLLMRLVWQTFMFFMTPFLSVTGNLKSLRGEHDPLLEMIALCRRQDWTALRASVEDFQEQKYRTLRDFYQNRVLLPASGPQVSFTWSGYQKVSQICYSLGMELLIAIIHGTYPQGTLLPSLGTLAQEKQVSLNTARRTITLLNRIGAVKSINGVGTRVLPPELIKENCDLSKPMVRERLLDFTRSLHILYLSCKQVAEATVSALDKAAIENWKDKLNVCRRTPRHELMAYVILDLISQDAPYRTVRTVYTELFQQLFWGYTLRSMEPNPHSYVSYYLPYFDIFQDCLAHSDAAEFSVKLEELMEHEVKFAISQLAELGIDAASELVLGQH